MTSGGDTIENFGFGAHNQTYSGWELMSHTEFTGAAISAAMAHFYTENGGLENLNPGFNSSNCCITSADLSGDRWYGFGGNSYMYPANSSNGAQNCNATYTDSLMLLWGSQTGVMSTLTESEVQKVQTYNRCSLSGNPGIFIDRWQ